MMLTAMLLLLAQVEFPAPPTDTAWDTGRCTQRGDSVTCGTAAFKVLTDTIIELQGDVEKLQLMLTSKDAQLDALRAQLLAVPPPVVVQPVAKYKPLIAVISAVLGTMALAVSIIDDNFSTGARVGLGITGVAAVAGGFILVF